MSKKKVILYVEDDSDDQELLLDAIRSVDKGVEVLMIDNGLKAINYLESIKQNSEQPCLIILDLNLPYLTGKEVFTKIKSDAYFAHIPVVIFSSSEKPEDKALFNKEGVEYFVKPADYQYMKSIAGHFISVCCC